MSELKISEHFYSIQGEGITTGTPSYFIRLKGCNLSCGFSPKNLGQLKKNIEAGGGTDIDTLKTQADLFNNEDASWFCDTAAVWLFGTSTSSKEILDGWKEQGLLESILDGTIHVIWTGGEPTLPTHQRAISDFLNECKTLYPFSKIYSEIETNGTIYIEDHLFEHLDQINCSVKLANSGMEYKKRVVKDALERIMSHHNYSFKFVVSAEEDLEEIFNTFIHPFNIPLKNVCMMPGLDNRDDFHERTQFVLEMAKRYKIRGLTRLHISAWDKATGV